MKFLLPVLILFSVTTSFAHAQEVVSDTVTYVKAQVTDVLSSEVREIPGTGTKATYQTIKVKILEGATAGQVITVNNDYLSMSKGDVFYLMHTVNSLDGKDTYAVSEPYRIPVLEFFGVLFIAALVFFGGKQGVRGLIALVLSLFFISYLLLPGILNGYSPVLIATAISSIIIVVGSYITHGFNRTTTAAVVGMLITIVITGLLSWAAIHYAQLSGYSSEESVYLNFNTHGSIDFVGLLLGSLMIGFLGVLYDAAISQAIAVEELKSAGSHLSHTELYKRGLRIGREHIGALVNTLAIAYVGAALPLLLLFETSTSQSIMLTVNQELFATEILRILIGSTGLILAVPITTLIAVYMLHGREATGHTHTHSH